MKTKLKLLIKNLAMMTRNKILWGAMVALLVMPVAASAAIFISKEDGAATLDKEASDDVFIAGKSVTIDKAVEDDIYAAGNMVEVRTNGGADVHAAGNTVRISGTYADDILAAGNSVVIGAEAEDVMAAGSTVEINGDSKISGDAYLAGALVVVSGNIEGTARITGEQVEIKSTAVIGGDVLVYSENEPIVEEGAVIEGERSLRRPSEFKQRDEATFDVLNWVRGVLTWFLVAILLSYFMPTLTREKIAYAMASGGKSFGMGLLWILLFIPALIFLMLTIIGMPIGMALVGLTVVLGVSAMGYAALLTGKWLMKMITKQESDIAWQHALAGAVALKLVALVPILGGMVVMVIWMIAFGAAVIMLGHRLMDSKKDKVVTEV